MQVFTKEWKAIQKAIDKCRGERAEKGNELLKLKEGRKKIFVDIALGKISSSKKEISNKRIRELEEDISDLDIMIEELKIKETVLKKTGSDVEELKEMEM